MTNNIKSKTINIKVVLLGEASVGKTSIKKTSESFPYSIALLYFHSFETQNYFLFLIEKNIGLI